MDQSEEPILFKVHHGSIAVITFNRPKSLNSVTWQIVQRLTDLLRKIAKMDNIVVTVVTGNGKFFSSGADVKSPETDDAIKSQIGSVRRQYLTRLSSGNLDLARALLDHPKILVAALNGPAIGISAAMLGQFDFVYAVENAYLLTPFSNLGIPPELSSSFLFVQRMGIAKANEALILSKKITAQELLARGFANKLFPDQPASSFHASLIAYVHDRFSDIPAQTMLMIKQLIRQPYRQAAELANVNEVMVGASQFASGIPQEEFRKIASKEKRHKL